MSESGWESEEQMLSGLMHAEVAGRISPERIGERLEAALLRRRRRSTLRLGAVAASLLLLTGAVVTLIASTAGRNGGVRPTATSFPASLSKALVPGETYVAAVGDSGRGDEVILAVQCRPGCSRLGGHLRLAAVSRDNGASWTVHRIRMPLIWDQSVYFVRGVAWYYGGWYSRDGGLSWEKARAGGDRIESVSAAGKNVWAVGTDCRLRSYMQGPCGTTIFKGNGRSGGLRALTHQPEGTMTYVTGSIVAASTESAYFESTSATLGGDAVFVTHDGGVSWKRLRRTCPAGYSAVGFPSIAGSKVFWQYCSSAGAAGKILLVRTSDGGRTFSSRPVSAAGQVYASSASTAWLFQEPALRTDDGGAKWRQVTPKLHLPAKGGFHAIPEAFLPEGPDKAVIGYMVRSAKLGSYLIFARTNNGGERWQQSPVSLRRSR